MSRHAVLRHDTIVIASSVSDVVASAGGWLFDRRMAGWHVSVLAADRVGEPALRILGAESLDLDGALADIAVTSDRAASLVVAADIYAADNRVRRFVSAFDRSGAEVALWGDAGALGENVAAVAYRLGAAARAFKAQALLAAGGSSDRVAETETLFRYGVTALAQVAR
jgi:hypothetical protein